MRDQNRALVGNHVIELSIDLIFRHGIKRGRKLVENVDGTVVIDRSCNGELLIFSPGEIDAVIVDHPSQLCVQTFRKLIDYIADSYSIDDFANFFTVLLGCHRYVLRKCQIIMAIILKNGRKQLCIKVNFVFVNIDAVEQDFSLGWEIKAKKQLDKGSFSRSVLSHNAQPFVPADFQIDIFKNKSFASGVSEGNISEFYHRIGVKLRLQFSRIVPAQRQIHEIHHVLNVQTLSSDPEIRWHDGAESARELTYCGYIYCKITDQNFVSNHPVY